jgi:hypothetical protein
MLKPIPKIETELNLINTMVNVLTYETQIADKANPLVIKTAHEIMANKVIELSRMLQNPTRFDQGKDDLIDFSNDKN